MNYNQWHEDQAEGERAFREFERRCELDARLCDALRASGIYPDDARSIAAHYDATDPAARRIVAAMQALADWLRDGDHVGAAEKETGR